MPPNPVLRVLVLVYTPDLWIFIEASKLKYPIRFPLSCCYICSISYVYNITLLNLCQSHQAISYGTICPVVFFSLFVFSIRSITVAPVVYLFSLFNISLRIVVAKYSDHDVLFAIFCKRGKPLLTPLVHFGNQDALIVLNAHLCGISIDR